MTFNNLPVRWRLAFLCRSLLSWPLDKLKKAIDQCSLLLDADVVRQSSPLLESVHLSLNGIIRQQSNRYARASRKPQFCSHDDFQTRIKRLTPICTRICQVAGRVERVIRFTLFLRSSTEQLGQGQFATDRNAKSSTE